MDATPSLSQDLRAVADGDRSAWERLVQALAARLHAAAYRILGDAHAADDATQDAFVALGRAAARFRGEDDAAVGRWAVAIACRIALTHARGRGRREQRVRTGLPAEIETMAAEPPPEGADPATLAAAMQALHRLPEQHRLPIVLHVFGSLDGSELARELGLSANAARVRLHRAFRKLAALLAAQGVTAAPTAVCATLAKTSLPLPGHDLLARCRGLVWRAPPPSHVITAKGIIMGSSAAAGLALAAWFALSHVGSANEAPAPEPADPPRATAPMPDPAPPKLSLQWQIEGPGNSFAATPPAVAGDAVLLSGSAELRCVDRQTGALRWSLPGKFEHSRPGIHGDEVIVMMGDAVESIALKDGSRRWSAAVDGGENDASVVVHGDRALIATRAGTLWSLDLANQGEVQWKAEHHGETAWAPGIGERGDVLLPLWNHAIVCLDETAGKERWRAEVGGLGAEAPVCRDGVVYALGDDSQTQAGAVVALEEASGKQRWRKDVPQDRLPPPPSRSSSGGDGGDGVVVVESGILPMKTVSACAGPVRVGEVLVVGSATDLLAYAPDGTLRWRLPFAAFGYRTFTVDARNRVWAGGDHGELLVASASGRELLRADLNRDPEMTRRPVTESVGGGKSFASVGSVSNPGADGDQFFVLTTGGVALCWTTKAQF